MPDAAQDIHDTQDLGERVGALMDDMQGSAPAPGPTLTREQAGAPPGATASAAESAVNPESPNGTASPGEGVSQSHSSVGEPGWEPAPEPPRATVPPTSASASEDDLASAVKRLIDSAPAAPAKAAPIPPESQRIDSLDAELAGLADDLIAGEFKDEPAVLEEPTAGAPTPTPADDTAPMAVTEATTAARPSEPVAPVAPAAEPAPAAAIELAPERLPLLLRAMDAISAPLRNRSQHTRDLVGWNALWLAFLGLCVWGYILFFRPAEGPQAARGAPTKQHAAESTSEGHASSGHGEPATKKDAKSRAPRKPTAKKAAPSGGH